jgi:hypothetical protein
MTRAELLAALKEDNADLAVNVPMLRRRLRDYAQFNEIFEQVMTDDELADAIVDSIADFNALPPFMGDYDERTFPDRKLLLDTATCEALQRLVLWHAQNQFSASDAGLQIPIHEQWQGLMQIEQMLRARSEQRAARLKAQLNVQRAWGPGVSSPLWREF